MCTQNALSTAVALSDFCPKKSPLLPCSIPYRRVVRFLFKMSRPLSCAVPDPRVVRFLSKMNHLLPCAVLYRRVVRFLSKMSRPLSCAVPYRRVVRFLSKKESSTTMFLTGPSRCPSLSRRTHPQRPFCSSDIVMKTHRVGAGISIESTAAVKSSLRLIEIDTNLISHCTICFTHWRKRQYGSLACLSFTTPEPASITRTSPSTPTRVTPARAITPLPCPICVQKSLFCGLLFRWRA